MKLPAFELFLLSTLQVTLSLASCEIPEAFSVPISNVELENGETRRGMSLSMGTPAQHLSIMPHMSLNHTWIYNNTLPLCDQLPIQQCITERGGLYDPSDSSTASQDLNFGDIIEDSFSNDPLYNTSHWGQEYLTVNQTHVDHFDFIMPSFRMDQFQEQQSYFGLGTNSSILTRLKDDNRIASRVYSFWWGQDTAAESNKIDGSIVFGGYDAAKVQGPNRTYPIQPSDQDCLSGMYVTVTDIKLDFPNGTSSSITSPSTFAACLKTNYPSIMTLNQSPFWSDFLLQTNTESYGNSYGINWLAPQFPSNAVYSGGLTISLVGGLDFSIPNDLLVVPDTYVTSNGSTYTNTSASNVLLSPKTPPNLEDTTIMGTYFFQSAYIMVNLDEMTFTLWQAKPTTESNLVTVGGTCGNSAQSPGVNAPGTNVTSNGGNASNGTAPPTQSDEEEDHFLSRQTVTGAAIGSVFGAAIVASIFFIAFLRRRRRRRRREVVDDAKMKEAETFRHITGLDKPYDRPPSPMFELGNDYQVTEAAGSMRVELPSEQLHTESMERKSTRSHTLRKYDSGRFGGYSPQNTVAEIG